MSSYLYDAGREESCICTGHKGEYVRDPECAVCNAREEVEPEPAPELSECPTCGDVACYVLGTLGNRTHYRCQNCGAECSSKAALALLLTALALLLTCAACAELPEPPPEVAHAALTCAPSPALDRRCMIQSNAAVLYDHDAVGRACSYRCQ